MQNRSLRIRSATREDHATFARLFPELGVDDPVWEPARFEAEMMPRMLVAEENGAALGYVYAFPIGETTHVSQLVVAPSARGRGVGRTLLVAVAERARADGCTTWRLNVRPGNAPAIALYERVGMKRQFEGTAIRIAWSAIGESKIEGRAIEPPDDARVERTMKLLPGQLAQARAARRVLWMLEGDAVEGAAAFDPTFPGAAVFRVARPELAVVLLRALRPHARPGDAVVNVKIEDQPEVARAIVALGGHVRLEMIHMAGPL